jgi:hypothetical protein
MRGKSIKNIYIIILSQDESNSHSNLDLAPLARDFTRGSMGQIEALVQIANEERRFHYFGESLKILRLLRSVFMLYYNFIGGKSDMHFDVNSHVTIKIQ